MGMIHFSPFSRPTRGKASSKEAFGSVPSHDAQNTRNIMITSLEDSHYIVFAGRVLLGAVYASNRLPAPLQTPSYLHPKLLSITP